MERTIFMEENKAISENGSVRYLKLVAMGNIDDTLLDALEGYIKRQRQRLRSVTGPRVEP